MPRWLEIVVFRTWWRYQPSELPWVTAPYHVFNLLEGGTWVVFAGLVLRRAIARHRSALEMAYALAFFTFGLTDFREAYALDSWLIWLKAINLVVLLKLRAMVIGRYYQTSKLY